MSHRNAPLPKSFYENMSISSIFYSKLLVHVCAPYISKCACGCGFSLILCPVWLFLVCVTQRFGRALVIPVGSFDNPGYVHIYGYGDVLFFLDAIITEISTLGKGITCVSL